MSSILDLISTDFGKQIIDGVSQKTDTSDGGIGDLLDSLMGGRKSR